MGCVSSKEGRRADVYAVKDNEPEHARNPPSGEPSPKRTVTTASSKGSSAALAKAKEGSQGAAADNGKASTPTRPRLDPKDFMFKNMTGEVRVKQTGSINGQAFMIDSCVDCDLYVLDHCAQVTIDDCKNCRIFIGPTDGSIFIRDCTGCKCVFLCRQLRTRDCRDIEVSLLCRTQPIIETTKNIKFGCYDLDFPGFYGLMKSAKLTALNNFWSHIYDFNPADANWSFLPPTTSSLDLLGTVPPEAAEVLTPSEPALPPADLASPLPSWGERGMTKELRDTYAFVVFPPAKVAAAPALLRAAAAQGTIIRTNQAVVNLGVAETIATAAAWPRGTAKTLTSAGGLCVGVELGGPGAAHVMEVAKQDGCLACTSEEAGAAFRYLGLDG